MAQGWGLAGGPLRPPARSFGWVLAAPSLTRPEGVIWGAPSCSGGLWGGAAPPALHPQVANTESLGEAPRLVLRLGLGADEEIDKSPPRLPCAGNVPGKGAGGSEPPAWALLGGAGRGPQPYRAPQRGVCVSERRRSP